MNNHKDELKILETLARRLKACKTPRLLNIGDVLEDAVECYKHYHSGAYECFHCGSNSVSCDADFDLEDYGYEGEGLVHVCHCGNCGAEIEYIVRFDQDEL